MEPISNMHDRKTNGECLRLINFKFWPLTPSVKFLKGLMLFVDLSLYLLPLWRWLKLISEKRINV